VVKIKNALQHFNTLLKKEQLEEEIFNEYPYKNIIGTSTSLRNVLKTIEKIAPTDVCVTITGETGTGKELIARAIHARSNRADEPFKPINAGALPEGTLQSELFGHEKGSFTGAYEKKIGFFESCKKGTLFMDEIGEISQQMQVNLLRVLENKKIIRVGGRDEIPVDVRILTATHQNLEKLVNENRFRKDLYYRIKNFMLHLPPLRERRKDIPVLIDYFIKKISNRPVEVSDEAIKLLMDYDYPGNIRELKNIIHHAMILMDGGIIRPLDLPADVTGKNKISELSSLLDLPWKEAKQLFEKKYIENKLAKAHGNISEVSRLTGIDRSDLHKKIEKLRIEK
jgi:transcriptional regulator with PAS, ATPase and Fis domain